MSRYFSGPDGVPHSFPDDVTPEEVRAALQSPVQAPPERPAPVYGPPASAARVNPYPAIRDRLRARATEAMPSMTGFLGGLVGTAGGPPGRALGAGIGGALGEAGREIETGQPFSGMHIAQQGMQQAGLSVGGDVAGVALRGLGNNLTLRSLGQDVVSGLAKRFNIRPEAIAEILQRYRLPTSAAGEQTALNTGAITASERNATIQGTPGTMTAQPLAQRAIRAAERLKLRPLTMSEKRVIIGKAQAEADRILTEATHGAVPKGRLGIPAQPASSVLNQYGQPAIPAQAAIPAPPSRYSPWEMEQIKEVAADNARGAYRADQAGESVAASPKFSKQLAASARAQLRTIPGVAAQNQTLREMRIAQQGIHGALAKDTGEFTGLRAFGMDVGVKLPRKSVGDLALFLTHPLFQATLRQSPRAAAELLSQMIHTDQPDQTGATR